LIGGPWCSSDEEPFLFFVHDTQKDRRDVTREDVSWTWGVRCATNRRYVCDTDRRRVLTHPPLPIPSKFACDKSILTRPNVGVARG